MIVAVVISYFIYNIGYWLPFGGGSPGPRFLIPALPFLALGLAPAYRRLPTLTLALAIPSVTFMVIGALTFPLIGETGTDTWANQLGTGALEHTVLTVLGVHKRLARDDAAARRGGAAIAFCVVGHATTPNGGHAPGPRRAARMGRGRGGRPQRGR